VGDKKVIISMLVLRFGQAWAGVDDDALSLQAPV
jgi:hypothetical protein